jgi:hypothetical protein
MVRVGATPAVKTLGEVGNEVVRLGVGGQGTRSDAAGCLGAAAMRYADGERSGSALRAAVRGESKGEAGRASAWGMNPDRNEASGTGSGVPDRL